MSLGLLLLCAAPVFGQNLSLTASLTSAVSSCAAPASGAQSGFARYQLPPNASAVAIALSGTWSGTVQFVGSADGINWASINAAPLPSGGSATSATSNGTWSVSPSGVAYVCAYASSYSSGAIAVSMSVSTGFYAGVAAAGPNTVSLSPSCGSVPNCYTVNDDVQEATQATYGTTLVGTTAAVAITTHDNDSGAEYIGNATGTTYPQGVSFTQSSTAGFGLIAGSFKTTGSGGTLGSCWGTNDVGSGTSLTIAVTPAGGANHALIAFAREAGLATITFSDSSGSNVWQPNVLSSALVGAVPVNMGYSLNVAGGSYNVVVTYGSSQIAISSFICEVSGIAASSALDGSGIANNVGGGTFGYTKMVTSLNVSANDFVYVGVSVGNTTSNFTAGTLGGTLAVTTTAADPPFVAGDVGKKVFADTSCGGGNGNINCFQSMYTGAIASVTDAHHITVSSYPIVANSAGTLPFTGWFVWGHDDTAALQNAWAQALTTPGMNLQLPCGWMFFNQPLFLSASTGAINNPSISGCGGGGSGTVLVPTPDFNYAKASGGIVYSYVAANVGPGVLAQNPFLVATLSNFSINGAGIDGRYLNGITGSNGLPVVRIDNADLENFNVVSWLWSSPESANTVPVISGASLRVNHVSGWTGGNGGLKITGDAVGSVVPNYVNDSLFGSQGLGALNSGAGLQLQGGHLISVGNQFCPGVPFSNTAGTTGAYQTGGTWQSFGDQISEAWIAGATASASFNSDILSYLNSGGLAITAGNVTANNTQIDLLALSGGSLTDQGGNYTCTAPAGNPCLTAPIPWTVNAPTITGGSFYGSASSTGVSLATGNVALTSGWGTGAAASAFSGDAHRGTFTVTEAGVPTSSPVLTLTYPTAFAVAPSSCTITQVGGNFTLLNPVITTLTRTTVAWTWSGTPITTDTYKFTYSCGP